MANDMKQVPLFNIPQEVEKTPLVNYTIPEIHYSSLEQLTFALQNRDVDALQFLLSETMDDDALKSKQDFINNYVSYCKELEQKFGTIHVQVIRGKCVGSYCPRKKQEGLSVSVNSVKFNKQLWVFNIVYEKDHQGCLDLGRCYEFAVSKEHI